MVFMDQTGAKIGATLWQELFPEFREKLRCGTAYVIQNVKVVENNSEYKVSKIPFLVYLVKTTSVMEAERPKIPSNARVITQFTDIIDGVEPRDTLVDIIGVVVEVIERKTLNPTYRVTVKLRDNSDAEMIMTVWEEYAVQLGDGKEKNHMDMKPLVIMLTLAKIKDPKDLTMPFYAGGLSEQGSGSQTQYSQYSLGSTGAKFLHNAQMVRLGEIARLRQDFYCLSVGTVDEVMIDTPWSYDSCPFYTTTFDPLKFGSTCRSCQNQVTETVPRYKLVLKLEQNGQRANFHFWDATCIKIFGKSADQCRQELIANDDEINVFPPCVDELLGKTWAVRFKYHVQMRQSSVLDVTEDQYIIQTITSTNGLQMDDVCTMKGKAVAAETSSQDYQPTPSLSQLGDYDPGLSAFVTPAKRMSDQQASSEFQSQEYTPYQLSTNKHIKSE